MTVWIKSFEPGPGVDSMAIALFPITANSLARLTPLRSVFQSLGLEQRSNFGFYI